MYSNYYILLDLRKKMIQSVDFFLQIFNTKHIFFVSHKYVFFNYNIVLTIVLSYTV